MNNRIRTWNGMLSIAAGGLLISISTGCNMFQNPFHDVTASQDVLTNPSVEGYRAIESTESKPLVRPHAETACTPHDAAIIHGPLYFEDPFEEKGSEDDRFAWTGEDYLHVFYWRARFLANAAFFPVSAVIQPPWREVQSDGERTNEGPVTFTELVGCPRAFDASPRK